jgi:hypothetical protein
VPARGLLPAVLCCVQRRQRSRDRWRRIETDGDSNSTVAALLARLGVGCRQLAVHGRQTPGRQVSEGLPVVQQQRVARACPARLWRPFLSRMAPHHSGKRVSFHGLLQALFIQPSRSLLLPNVVTNLPAHTVNLLQRATPARSASRPPCLLCSQR